MLDQSLVELRHRDCNRSIDSVRFCRISHTISVRASEDLAAWLEDTAAKSGVSKGKLVREQLEKARIAEPNGGLMRLAGSVEGPKNLSSGRGFSRA